MWIDAEFQPDSFWHQTPLHFQLAMEGARKRLTRESDGDMRLAWQTAAFSGAAQVGKLKPLEKYMKPQRRAQSSAEMLAAMREFAARGAKMNFRRVERPSA